MPAPDSDDHALKPHRLRDMALTTIGVLICAGLIVAAIYDIARLVGLIQAG